MAFSFCLVLCVAAVISASAQQNYPPYPTATPVPPVSGRGTPAPRATPRPTPKPRVENPTRPVYTPPRPIVGFPPQQQKKKIRNTSPGPAEKVIAVDKKVSVSLCVSSGDVKVNGRDSDEVRAFVDKGSSVGFIVRQSDRVSKKAAAIQVVAYDPKEHKDLNVDECLDGESIELDVPLGASVTIRSGTGDLSIDSIGKVRADNLRGSTSVRNITGSVSANTYEGDLTVEEVAGPIALSATTGQITVIDSKPGDINDPIHVKSRSGHIQLKNVEHSDIDVSSISGSLSYHGKVGSGGQYKFNTTSGKIDLNLTGEVSCKLMATYGGAFDMMIPFKDVIHNKQPGIQKLIALIGNGDASLTVTTFTGAILIKPAKK